jgi:hypothetical protein
VDLVFGSGKYGCLGKNIARIELNKVFVEVRDFVSGRGEWNIVLVRSTNETFKI